MRVAPGRVAAYGIENHAGTPVYVHAKVCVIDDVWASTGSDNFNRRSWTHDSELTAVVLDEDYARDLRLTLAAEHLDRLDEVERARAARGDGRLRGAGRDVRRLRRERRRGWRRGTTAVGWGSGRRDGCGRSRCRELSRGSPDGGPGCRSTSLHDPDGRPGPIRGGQDY